MAASAPPAGKEPSARCPTFFCPKLSFGLRFISDRVDLDLCIDHRPGFNGSASERSVREMVGEDAVVAADAAHLYEVHGRLHHVLEVGACFLQRAAHGVDGPARL